MALRSNHYDVAFEQYLRSTGIPYVAVDEQRRALLHQGSLKSMDFIVHSRQGRNLLVDVKGRKFPSGTAGHRWENWATGDDIESLGVWQQVFGQDFRAVLVFAYHLLEPGAGSEFDTVFEYRGRTYAFVAVGVNEYREAMRQRSPRWETVWLPSREFRRLRLPIQSFL